MQRLVQTALSLILAICVGAVALAAPPADRSYAVSLRRLTEQEYRNSIADIFGKEIEVRGSFEPTKRSNGLAAVSTAFLSVTPHRQSNASSSTPSKQHQFLDRYCTSCHNERLKTGGLSLGQVDLSKPGAQAELWEKVVRKLHTGGG